MVTAMRSVWGDERTRQWLVGIKNNMPQEYPKNTPTVAAAGSGEIDVGFVNHYYLYRFIEQDGESFGARNHHLDGGGPGSIILVSGAGILGNSSNRDNAEKFLRFLLSTPAQQYFASSTYEYPLTGNVKAHRLLKPLEKINNPNIDMASLDDLKGTQLMLRDLGIIP
jgi:iron(III) transport system substrate-binding protein